MNALFNISYGLYVLTVKDEKYNGCIINTLMQVTSTPNRVSVTINKDNYTTGIIQKTGEFNISILDKTADFEIFKHFGFTSGKNVDKFIDFREYQLAENGIPYITKSVNSYISAKVVDKLDVGTHITFVADVVGSGVLSSTESVTYDFYHKKIKPQVNTNYKKVVYVCRICGYEYDGDTIPDDFVCPICKHGKDDFVRQESNDTSKTEDSSKSTKIYYCPMCGYEVEAEENPGKCVLCGADMIEKG